MGNGESKLIAAQIGSLEHKINGLAENVNSIHSSISILPTDYILKSEFDPKLTRVEEDAATSNLKLSQLLELTRDQQEVIMELGKRYTELFDGYQTQQEALQGIMARCEEKLSKQEDELAGTRTRLSEIEKEVIENSELAKAIGIRRTENMIKKDTVSPLGSLKKTSNGIKPSDKNRIKLMGRHQVTRGQKKMENEKQSAPKEGAQSRTKENETMNEQENQPNFLDIIRNDKKGLISTPKETLTEVDLNTLV